MTPTQRSMKFFRDQGLVCGIVERWIPNPKHPGGGFRSDFLGCIDLIFLGPDGVVGVQSCGQDVSAHQKKLAEERADEMRSWLECPGTQFLLIGWRKVAAKRGGLAKVWRPRIYRYTLSTSGEMVVTPV